MRADDAPSATQGEAVAALASDESSREAIPPRWTYWAGLCVLALIAVSLYWPALTCGLLSDDWDLSAPDPAIWKSFTGHWWGGGHGTFYRPLSRLAIRGEAIAFGVSGAGQHAISFLLFLASAFFASFPLRRWFGEVASLLAAATIILCPIGVESVAWISSQTDLLAGFFLSFTLFLLLCPLEEYSIGRSSLCLATAALGYLSKDSSALTGPLVVVLAGCYVLHYGRRRVLLGRLFIGTIAAQLLLFIGYMLMRKVLLGNISVSGGFPEPLRGALWHRSLVYLRTLNEFAAPLAGWFPSAELRRHSAMGLAWVLAFPAIAVVLLLRARKVAALGLLVAWLATLEPLVSIKFPVYDSASVEGSRRFFYFAVLVLGPLLGVVLGRIAQSAGASMRAACVLLASLLFLQCGSKVSEASVPWAMAGEVRAGIERQLDELRSGYDGAVQVFGVNTPDNVRGAYIFRTGFSAFLQLKYPRMTFTKKEDLKLWALTPGARCLKFDYSGPDQPVLFPYPELEKALANLEKASHGPAHEQIRVDLSQPIPPGTLAFSKDVRLDSISDGEPGEFAISRPDPYITFGIWPHDALPASYHKAFIEMEFMEPAAATSGTPPNTDLLVMWTAPGYGRDAPLPNLTRSVPVKSGRQRIEFDLSQELRWLENDSIIWFRFSLGVGYAGRIKVYQLGFE